MHPQRILASLLGSAALIALGLAAAPRAQAQATQQTLYVSNGNGNILAFNGGGSYVFAGNSIQSSTFGSLQGLTFGNDGYLYAADGENFKIDKVTSGGSVSSFATVTAPRGLAFDSAGNLYAANNNQSIIVKVAPNATTSQFGPAFGNPTGLAFNGKNLYVATQDFSTIEEYASDGSTASVFANTNSNAGPDAGLSNGLAFDKAGNLYIAKSNNTTYTIEEITPAGVKSQFNTSFISGDLNAPVGLAFDNAGNLYVANSGDSTIEMFNSAGVGFLFSNRYSVN